MNTVPAPGNYPWTVPGPKINRQPKLATSDSTPANEAMVAARRKRNMRRFKRHLQDYYSKKYYHPLHKIWEAQNAT